MNPVARGNPLLNRLALGGCCCLLLISGILSYSAALTKSATQDEPVESLGGWLQLHYGDFRINFEHPPLWHYWVALANGSHAIHFDPNDDLWTAMPGNILLEWPFAERVLYQTGGNDGASFVNRSRVMMLVLGLTLGALVSIWSWKLGGPFAAIAATSLFALDPNIIAHESIVKNDVAVALCMTATFFAVWRVGNKLTWLNAFILALLVAAAINVKFSAILLGPMLAAVLFVRVIVPMPWKVLGITINHRLGRLGMATMLLVVIAATSYLGIWACYRFRFAPSPDPTINLDATSLHRELANLKFLAKHPQPQPRCIEPDAPTSVYVDKLGRELNAFETSGHELESLLGQHDAMDEQGQQMRNVLKQVIDADQSARALLTQTSGLPVGQQPPPEIRSQFQEMILSLQDQNSALSCFLDQIKSSGDYNDRTANLIEFLRSHKLFPTAWLNGMLKVYAELHYRVTFLMGELRGTGWWYYFPLAMLFKMPVSTGIAWVGAAVTGFIVVKKRWRDWLQFTWPVASLIVPAATFTIAAMQSRMDIGWRYMIPVYPFICIAAGVLLSQAIVLWKKHAVVFLFVLGAMLLCETVLAWPNYIAYFNFAVGGSRGGLNLLSDSNLDWGQDLPLLAKWQQAHPDVLLAAALFGSTDPEFYGIRYELLPSGYPDPQLKRTHILAISATKLQDTYLDGFGYANYRKLKPTEVLGGTIYLYDLRAEP